MLLSLTIRDFVIVSQLSLDCRSGLTVLSGETGAGKSILIDALSLCMGERSDAASVREGADAAQITAEFSLSSDDNDPVRALLLANDLPTDELLIRRVVYRTGKSRALVNETPVTAALLKQLADRLIDIHGQHAFQSLVRADEQRRLLDAHAGLLPLAATVQQAWRNWQDHEQALAAALSQQDQIALEREQLAWQLDEIDKIGPEADQWEQLSQQLNRLSHAAELMDGVQSALDQLTEADESVADRLRGLESRLHAMIRRDPSLGEAAELISAAHIQIEEAARSLSAYLRQVDVDPDRLAELEDRISRWHATARKLRIAPESLADKADDIHQRLQILDRQTDIDSLRQAAAGAQSQFMAVAGQLTTGRVRAAQTLSEAVSAAMQGLNLTGGVFVCAVEPGKAGAHGLDQIEFRVAGHAGTTPRPLAKVASGGELARISLAIAVITSQSSTIPTLIFDEVDSGIGGAVAETVGRYLRQLAERRQVLCVTHLPQVASQGHHHWRVSKAFDGTSTTSRIEVLAATDRVDEIARMLGGQTITDTVRATAAEMLNTAG